MAICFGEPSCVFMLLADYYQLRSLFSCDTERWVTGHEHCDAKLMRPSKEKGTNHERRIACFLASLSRNIQPQSCSTGGMEPWKLQELSRELRRKLIKVLKNLSICIKEVRCSELDGKYGENMALSSDRNKTWSSRRP